MNDWANYFAIIPSTGGTGAANSKNPVEGERFPSCVASGLSSDRYGRKLFLRVLLGSFFLAAGWNAAQATGASNLSPANIFHLHQHLSPGDMPSCQPASPIWYVRFRESDNLRCAALKALGAVTGQFSPARNLRCTKAPNRTRSNGAILAHQVHASSKPRSTARSGVATACPLEEGLNNKNLQVCTQGYPVVPGIPNPIFSRGAQVAYHEVKPNEYFMGGHPLQRLSRHEVKRSTYFMGDAQNQVNTTINDQSFRNL